MRILLTIFLLIFLHQILLSEDVVLVHTEGIPPDGGGHIINIDCINDTTCYAVFSTTGATTLYKTTDSGDNWELVNKIEPFDWSTSPQVFNPESAAFPSLDTIYITYEYGGHIRKSTDGGKTFNKIKVVSTDIDFTTNITMYDNNIGFIDALDSLLITYDGWNTFEMRDRKRLDEDTIYQASIASPHFVDSMNLHFSEITKFYNYNIKTDDLTVIHKIEQEPYFEYNNHIFDFQYINNIGFAAGGRRTIGSKRADIIFKTTDKGKNWTKILDSAYYQASKEFGLQAISFYDERNGIAVGQYGKVLLTNNGGESWKYIFPEIFYKHETEGQYGPLTLQVCWADKSPLIASFRGNIYKYVGDYFKFYSPDEMPVLLFPENYYTIGTKSVNFKWKMKDTLNNLIFKVSKDENFENIVSEKNLQPNTTETIESLPDTNTLYYWKVGIEKEDDIFWSNPNVLSFGLTTPQLLSPKDSSKQVSQNSYFSWTDIIGAQYYKLELCDNPYFSQNLQQYDSLKSNSKIIEGLELKESYYVRIMAYNDSLASDWSDINRFTVWDHPAPKLISPLNNSAGLDTSIVFEWSLVEEAWDYRLQLFDKVETITPFKEIHLQETSVKVDELEKDKTYFWCVLSRHEDGVSRSKKFSFSTIKDSIKLLFPENNYKYSDKSVEFLWKLKDTLHSYNFKLSENNDFSDIINDEITDTNFIKIENLNYGQQYFWQVTGLYQEKPILSEIYSFTSKLPEVELLNPKDKSYNQSTKTKLEWSKTENTDHYKLQLTDDESFSNILLNEDEINNTNFVTEALDSGITYFWRIKSFNQVSESIWSEIFSFTTDLSNSVSEPTNSGISVVPNPAEDYIEISMNKPSEGLEPSESSKIEIFDVLGEMVVSQSLNTLTPALSHRAREHRIDVSHLPKGMYFVKIGDRVEKFVKM